MNKPAIAFVVCLISATAAGAIQPVEDGLQPLYERIQVISDAQQLLNQRLQAVETSARERALAYRTYQVLEKERQQLAREIAHSKQLAQSPLVTWMVPGANAK